MCNAEPRNALGEYFAVPFYIMLIYHNVCLGVEI